MPWLLLLALLMAFGIDAPRNRGPMSWPETLRSVGAVSGGIALVAASAFALGRGVSGRIARRGHPTARLRRVFLGGARAVDLLTLAVYGWALQGIGWPRVVRSGLGLAGVVLLDDVLILLPFLLAQVLAWWGLHDAECALRGMKRTNSGRALVLKVRQSLGLLLPILLVFSLGQNVGRHVWPGAANDPRAQPVTLALMGVVVLIGSPAFVRLAWPTRPLPSGPLRDRLERFARRVGFRCTDILVWDTGGRTVNAGVTGSLPWFRYVLLTDALVENLDDREIAAVFGHEIGHIAHRHLLSFGVFLLGTLGVLALIGGAVEEGLRAGLPDWARQRYPTAVDVLESGTLLLALGLYFLMVFGVVSRRFERQADVFGCRAVSCGRGDCPPHGDLDGPPHHRAAPAAVALCPVGIRTFVNALTNVAVLNGMSRTARSWRHGSIARRIAFLEGLEGRPDAERHFQQGVVRLRLVLGLLLGAAVALAYATGSVQYLR